MIGLLEHPIEQQTLASGLFQEGIEGVLIAAFKPAADLLADGGRKLSQVGLQHIGKNIVGDDPLDPGLNGRRANDQFTSQRLTYRWSSSSSEPCHCKTGH